jgi:hypothetical protein
VSTPDTLQARFVDGPRPALPEPYAQEFADVGAAVDAVLEDVALDICGRYAPLPPSGEYDDLGHDSELLTDYDNALFFGGDSTKEGSARSLTFAWFEFVDAGKARAGWDRLVAAVRDCSGEPDRFGSVQRIDSRPQLPDLVGDVPTRTTSFTRSFVAYGSISTTGVLLSGRVLSYVEGTGATEEDSRALALRGWKWQAQNVPRGN